ncbi:MAG TPA: dihydrolipoamide acetyltransferase family protein [Nitrolancea sp.]|nr:dihydrolipoamide acetyltransferase family protein [Nitrolancea sp.]
MAKTVVMPQMGYDMDAGTLLRWLKQEGETIGRGEPIAEIETDKVNLEIESFDGGIVHKHLVTEGETVPVGQPIAIIGEPGEVIDEPSKPASAGAATSQASQPAAPAATNGVQSTTTLDGTTDQVFERAPGERVRASPLVKRLAAEHGINLHAIRGTGPGGRIVKADILPHVGRPAATPIPPTLAPSAPEVGRVAPAAQVAPRPAPSVAPVASPASETRDLTRIRKTIARRMSESFQQAPHFYITMPVDMGKALRLRQEINEQVEAPQKVSINDLVVKASALALRKFPMLNASYAGESIQVHQRIDISIAVALEEGLISPFISDTDHKPLGEIAAASKDLIERARNGGLTPEEYQGGTFTISNLGMYGVESFSAIINPPQVAILAVGGITKEPVYQDGQFVPADIMRVTISADHRVTDGAEAARFLAELKHLLESPMLLVVS